MSRVPGRSAADSRTVPGLFPDLPGNAARLDRVALFRSADQLARSVARARSRAEAHKRAAAVLQTLLAALSICRSHELTALGRSVATGDCRARPGGRRAP